MSDAASPFQPAGIAGQSQGGALTPERIERTLADFRDWMTSASTGMVLPATPRAPVDLHTVVGQFIALRHEVNLQTKAARASLEQNAETLRRLDDSVQELQEVPETESDNDNLRPLLKALIDIYDILALSFQQVERQKAAIQAGLDTVLESATIEPPPEIAETASVRPGFWQRLFGSPGPVPTGRELDQWRERVALRAREREGRVRTAVDFLRQGLDGLLTGYSMSLNRIERVLPKFGLERFVCQGQRFDPEMMEVVDVVTGGNQPAGEVVEEVRRGYRLNGVIFRYAQVKVAK